MANLVKLDSPLGADVLLFRRMVGREALGRPFSYELELLSKNRGIQLSDVVGQPMTIQFELPGGKTRFWNGIVARFAMSGSVGRYALYTATLRPWLWLLTHRAGCRIFQGEAVGQIFREICEDYHITDFSDDLLTGTYPPREYRVQYRETDFDFVSRILEQEGIYYYFEHRQGQHKLILADAYSGHAPIPGYESVPYYSPQGGEARDREELDTWSFSQELQPGAYALNDFDFERPKASLLVKLTSQSPIARPNLEIYDYPGAYTSSSNGESYVKVRLEELYADEEVAEGGGNARGLTTGGLFRLTDFPREDQNREYLIIGAEYELSSGEYEALPGGETDTVFRCKIAAIDSKRPFRPKRTTPIPVVRGPQTAIVVGKGGEEIWTDQHGRVKLKFHWDRSSKHDESSSCWVRVAQVWAGNKWGAIHIPRIGQEVVVDFLEGDPDRPLVTGRVYNGDSPPPYGLPANQTQSGIKSRSTKDGGDSNFNELRFEDRKGEEQIFMQAEKNMDTLVKNDQSLTVGHDRKKDIKNDETTTVGGNRTETVAKDETITINGGRTETVAKDESITINGGRTETVAKDEGITVGGSRTESVGADESIDIGAGQTISIGKGQELTVGADQSISVGGGRSESVGKDESVSIGAGQSISVEKDQSVSVGGSRALTVGKDDTVSITGSRVQTIGKDESLKVTGKALISAGDELVLQVGDATVTLKKNGDIVVKGANLVFESSGKVGVKASGAVKIKGSEITNN